MNWILFIISIVVYLGFGIFVYALCRIAKQADEKISEMGMK